MVAEFVPTYLPYAFPCTVILINSYRNESPLRTESYSTQRKAFQYKSRSFGRLLLHNVVVACNVFGKQGMMKSVLMMTRGRNYAAESISTENRLYCCVVKFQDDQFYCQCLLAK